MHSRARSELRGNARRARRTTPHHRVEWTGFELEGFTRPLRSGRCTDGEKNEPTNKTRADEKPRRRAALEFDPKVFRRLDANTTVLPEVSDQLCVECYSFSLIPGWEKKQDLNKQVLLRKKKTVIPAL